MVRGSYYRDSGDLDAFVGAMDEGSPLVADGYLDPDALATTMAGIDAGTAVPDDHEICRV